MTPDGHDAFGELRAMLEQIPSVSGFTTIISLIEHYAALDESGQIERQWLPYTAQKLDRSWPNEMRQCPGTLLHAYEKGEALWCPLIRAISFENERLNKDRVKQLIATTHMHQITHLNLRSCYIRWQDLADLAERSPFGQIESLDIYKSTQLPKSAHPFMIRFFESSMLEGLTSLSFRNWGSLKAVDYELFTEHFPLQSLTKLYMDKISAKRFKALLDTGKLEQLEELTVRGPNMLRTLSTHTGLAHLKHLDIAGYSERELKFFAKATHFTKLETLHMSVPNTRDEAFARLMTLQTLPALSKLSLAFAPVFGPQGVAEQPDWEEVQQEMLTTMSERLPANQLDSLKCAFWDGMPALSLLLNPSTHDRFASLTALDWGSNHQFATHDAYNAYIRASAETLAAFPFRAMKSLYLRFEWRNAKTCSGALTAFEECEWIAGLELLKCYGPCLSEACYRLVTALRDTLALRVFGCYGELEQWAWKRLSESANVSRLEVLETSVVEMEPVDEFAAALSEDITLFPALRCVMAPRLERQMYYTGWNHEWRDVLVPEPRWIALGSDHVEL